MTDEIVLNRFKLLFLYVSLTITTDSAKVSCKLSVENEMTRSFLLRRHQWCLIANNDAIKASSKGVLR